MAAILASTAVALAGIYLIGLATLSVFQPSFASRFLLGFAGSAQAHYAELSARSVVGFALVHQAPSMLFSGFFRIFAWVLLATTAGLLLVPWRWHHRFAQKVVPPAMRYIKLIGVASFLLGAVFLIGLIGGASLDG
ncbi:MAG: hypothetical protein KJO33_07500 [Gammaproteobacteria bacterium]|nr:hypothetical protein [Gammaproteobacteria bacterium]